MSFVGDICGDGEEAPGPKSGFAHPVDLFLRCDESEGISKLKAIYEACQSVAKSLPQIDAHKNMLITRTSCTVTIFISHEKQIPPVQVPFCGSIG